MASVSLNNGEREWEARIAVLVHVSVASEGFEYIVKGRLAETLETNPATGAVIAQIPVLKLLSQGKSEDEARQAVAEMFEEFCQYEFEQKSLIQTLVYLGFVVSRATEDEVGRVSAPQYLEISWKAVTVLAEQELAAQAS